MREGEVVDKKVLIVDDQYGVRNLLSLALAKYQIKEAINGQKALEIAQEWEPDLIIIDMKMPGLNGVETISAIHQLKINTKFLLMTAYSDQEIIIEDVKISGFINKPFDLDQLIEMVENILNEKPGS